MRLIYSHQTHRQFLYMLVFSFFFFSTHLWTFMKWDKKRVNLNYIWLAIKFTHDEGDVVCVSTMPLFKKKKEQKRRFLYNTMREYKRDNECFTLTVLYVYIQKRQGYQNKQGRCSLIILFNKWFFGVCVRSSHNSNIYLSNGH